MRNRFRNIEMRTLAADLLALLALAASVALWWRVAPGLREDVDRFYHYALSREMAERGLVLPALPQVEGLGWQNYFFDTGFLYHVFTAGAWRVDGETGVFFANAALAAALVALLYALARVFTGALASFAIVALAALLNPAFLYRLGMVRPHLFAISAFVIMLLALFRSRPKLALAAGFMFSLAYHAFYLPGAVLGFAALAWFVDRARDEDAFLRSGAYGLAGIVGGALVHPYFPTNVIYGFASIGIAASDPGTGFEVGGEIYPYSLAGFFGNFAHALLWGIGGATLFLRAKMHERRETRTVHSPAPKHGLTLALATVCFTFLLFRSARSVEYAIPCFVGLLAWLAARIGPRRLVLVGIALLVLHIPTMREFWRLYLREPHLDRLTASARAALEKVPERGTFVFNCNWGLGPYILYYRPDLRFVDLMEPTMLFHRAPLLAYSKDALFRGYIVDPAREIRSVFRADWVLCDSGSLNLQLGLDPQAERVSVAGPPVQLFRLRERDFENWVRRLEFMSAGGPPRTLRLAESSVYFDSFGENAPAACGSLTIPPEEMNRFRGKEWLGLAGGDIRQLRWNGQALLAPDRPPIRPTGWPKLFLIEGWLKLPRPLRAHDEISIELCPDARTRRYGLALSLWTASEQAHFREKLETAWKK